MLLSLLATLASAQEVGAIIRPEAEIDLASDRPEEDAAAVRTRIRAWAKGATPHDGSWFLEVRGVNEILIGEDLEGRWEGEIGESGWEGEIAGPVRLRIGNLVERWGKLDLLPVVDVLNPRDLRFGPIQPQEWQRTPVPMAVVEVGNDTFRSETTWLPFAVHDRIAIRGTDWSFIRQGTLEGVAEDAKTWEGGLADVFEQINVTVLDDVADSIADLDPSYRRASDAATLERNTPQDTFLTPEIGQRFVVNGKGFDLAVMGARIHSRQPQAQLNSYLAHLVDEGRLPETSELRTITEIGDTIEVAWPMTWVAGAEASTLVGPIGVRAEGAWTSDEVVRLQWGGARTTPTVAAGLGLDYVHGSSFAVMAEARWKRLLDANGSTLDDPRDLNATTVGMIREELLFSRSDMLQIAGGVRWSTLADRLTLQLGGTYDVVFAEYLVRPSVSYRVSDHLLLEGGAAILGGATAPPKNLKQAMTYEGGLLSYFGQNDAITLGFSWIL